MINAAEYGEYKLQELCFLRMSGIRILAGAREFLSSNQPPIQQLPGAKQRKHEVNHFSPPSAEVKNEWSCTSTTPIFLKVMDMESFTYFTTKNLSVLFLKRGQSIPCPYSVGTRNCEPDCSAQHPTWS